MRAMSVVVPGIAARDTIEMPFIHDEEVIQALGPDRPYESARRRPIRLMRLIRLLSASVGPLETPGQLAIFSNQALTCVRDFWISGGMVRRRQCCSSSLSI